MVISAKTLRAGGHAPTSFRSGGTGPHDSDSWVELNMQEMSSSAHLAVSPHELPRLHFSGPAKSVVRPLQVWDGPGGTVPTSTKSDIRSGALMDCAAAPANQGRGHPACQLKRRAGPIQDTEPDVERQHVRPSGKILPLRFMPPSQISDSSLSRPPSTGHAGLTRPCTNINQLETMLQWEPLSGQETKKAVFRLTPRFVTHVKPGTG
ncbi:hypothetical protein CCHR01_02895 [Colletotrichum chrysophilum]|uniref:Uncharacterized protein n=1 Tax=Colletotrichum chrysophilum TaxID=1836956 RepID=A0AAD9AXJ1_9PEZI|nr:hypothetical protein CCHR01_02895 [Colletotrichum chrysophilum]